MASPSRCAFSSVKDCVYRFVDIPPLCLLFLDTPPVQRMRRVKQLGVVQHVYPSATHTRFEHILGVMHLAGRMVDHLRATGEEISDREKHLVQLAGLLHDVGHLALSHLGAEADPDAQPHEERSVQVLRRLNRELGSRERGRPLTAQEEHAVACMILGRLPEDPALSARHGGVGRAFLYQIVSNSRCGLDVDRMDYLARDAHHTGLPSFQPDYILRSARVDPETGELAFRRKCRGDVEDLFRTRLRNFEAVYQHPKVVAFQRLYLEGMRRLGFRADAGLPWDEFQRSDDARLETELRDRAPDLMARLDRRRCADGRGEEEEDLTPTTGTTPAPPSPPSLTRAPSSAERRREARDETNRTVEESMARVPWVD